jgi:hypothetical protein
MSELYIETARRRGGDPNIGSRLPALLMAAEFEKVQMNMVQPAEMTGEVKLLAPITMENLAEAVIEEGLASQAEIDGLVAELYELCARPRHR